MLHDSNTSLIVSFTTMAPAENLEVIKPIQVTVQPYENEFRADFWDANLTAFGETADEAVRNLKDLITATFDTLIQHENRLGRGVARELAVLKLFIRKSV